MVCESHAPGSKLVITKHDEGALALEVAEVPFPPIYVGVTI
jgi:hypothetical protein